MEYRRYLLRVCLAALILFGLTFGSRLSAQNGTGSIHVQVTDPSGRAVPGASIQTTRPGGQTLAATAGSDGTYDVRNLAPGQYTVSVAFAGFATYTNEAVNVAAERAVTLNVSLAIVEQTQQVTVTGEAESLDTSPSNNASAVVVSGKELDALPDDPDELASDLQSLAGPTAGPSGGQMYVDGFTAGQLPPKSSIREVRINQNPFSAEFDRMGFGRIEIFTKPGTNDWHGSVSVNRNQAAFNSRNPFATARGDFQSTQYNGNVGGPLGKRISTFFNADVRDIANESVISAVILDSSFNPISFSALNPLPQTRLNIGPRLDFQVTKNNTFSARYQYLRNRTTNNGVGNFALPAQGSNVLYDEHQLQLVDSQYIGTRVVYETRFQYLRQDNSSIAANLIPSINVPGAFTGGGGGNFIDVQNHYELQSYTSVAFVKHFLRFGVRVREVTDSNNSSAAFFGNFQFPSLTAFQIMEQNLAGLDAGTTSWATVRGLGGGPSQFSITTGNPHAYVSTIDAGPFVEDDWKVLPSVMLSYGLRLETQNHISDHLDWAPRVGVAWGIGGARTAPKVVLRAGWGVFYDRFAVANILQAQRQNGITEQQYIVPNPNFYCGPTTALSTTTASACPSPSTLAGMGSVTPTIYQIAPAFHAPYLYQTAATLEWQATKSAQVAFIYLNVRGVDQLIEKNVNSPVLPGTTIPASAANGGVYPNGIAENIYQYASAGKWKGNLLVPNATIRSRMLTLNFYYVLSFTDSTPNGFVSNAYNISQDYGRAPFDVRQRALIIGTIKLPYGFSLAPFLMVNSGTPFNVTLGTDLIGSSLFNQRPSFASSLSNPANVVMTKYGAFDTVPVAGETLVPINYLTGPGMFQVNLQLTKTFTFGPKPPEAGGPSVPFPPAGSPPPQGPVAAGGRYSFAVSVNARNIFNNVNLSTPVGNITSPLFGESESLAGNGPGGTAVANRQVYLQGTFSF
jgi:hypothetical protein